MEDCKMKDLVTSLRESASRSRGREVDATLVFGPGYTSDQVDELSEKNGIYVAYACEDGGDKYLCKRILYIGKAEGDNDSIKKRVADHINDRDSSDSGKQSVWERDYCDEGEFVVYNFAEYDSDLHDIEAVLIAKNDVCANIHNNRGECHTDAWHVVVNCSGQVGMLHREVNHWKLLRGSK